MPKIFNKNIYRERSNLMIKHDGKLNKMEGLNSFKDGANRERWKITRTRRNGWKSRPGRIIPWHYPPTLNLLHTFTPWWRQNENLDASKTFFTSKISFWFSSRANPCEFWRFFVFFSLIFQPGTDGVYGEFWPLDGINVISGLTFNLRFEDTVCLVGNTWSHSVLNLHAFYIKFRIIFCKYKHSFFHVIFFFFHRNFCFLQALSISWNKNFAVTRNWEYTGRNICGKEGLPKFWYLVPVMSAYFVVYNRYSWCPWRLVSSLIRAPSSLHQL